MENITMTNPTQIIRVRFACARPADLSLTAAVRGLFYASTQAPSAVKDVAYLRAWKPPV
jgi:hypothetical protein